MGNDVGAALVREREHQDYAEGEIKLQHRHSGTPRAVNFGAGMALQNCSACKLAGHWHSLH